MPKNNMDTTARRWHISRNFQPMNSQHNMTNAIPVAPANKHFLYSIPSLPGYLPSANLLTVRSS